MAINWPACFDENPKKKNNEMLPNDAFFEMMPTLLKNTEIKMLGNVSQISAGNKNCLINLL